ncbi:MAG: methyltransferase [Bacteroidetes bacterium]|nr:methyltransferase [Bacteroidota bacterium]
MFNTLNKHYTNVVVKPFLKWYLKKPRGYKHGNLTLKIYPGVFHPAYFFSTLFFSDYLNTLELKNKMFCEVGAGSALISFRALEKGARVVALELSEVAIKGIKENIQANELDSSKITVVHSDLFDSIPSKQFDVVFINPPYFFKDITDVGSLAWNCGTNGQYFSKLFTQLGDYVHEKSDIYLTLAENCEIERISDIGNKSGWYLMCEQEKKIKWEKNFIFKLNRK